MVISKFFIISSDREFGGDQTCRYVESGRRPDTTGETHFLLREVVTSGKDELRDSILGHWRISGGAQLETLLVVDGMRIECQESRPTLKEINFQKENGSYDDNFEFSTAMGRVN